MAIDPMLYEKISGRSADPSKRLGQALAANDQRTHDRHADAQDPLRQARNYYLMKYAISGGVFVVFLIVFLIWRLTQ